MSSSTEEKLNAIAAAIMRLEKLGLDYNDSHLLNEAIYYGDEFETKSSEYLRLKKKMSDDSIKE